MRRFATMMVGVLLTSLSGCEQQSGNPEKAKGNQGQPAVPVAHGPEQPKPSDPLVSFKALAEKTKRAIDGQTPVWLQRDKPIWSKVRLSPEKFAFDVKKTDSLVSPHIGLITFDSPNILIGEGPDKTSVEAMQGPGKALPTGEPDHWRLAYAFQENRWNLQTIERRMVVKAKLSDGEKTIYDSGLERPKAGGLDADVIVPLIEVAAK